MFYEEYIKFILLYMIVALCCRHIEMGTGQKLPPDKKPPIIK
jgi:hypothetical protein